MPQAVPSETAAVLIEPVLGEGGYVVPSPGYIKALRTFCDKHGLLLIADEVSRATTVNACGSHQPCGVW